MDLVAAVSPMTCAALVAVVLVKPSVRVKGHNVNIFWVVPFLGAAVLMLCGTISPREVFAGLTAQSSINPLKILVLFLSMTLISIFLDCAGFFRHLAIAVLQRQNANQLRLFVLLYALVSVLTVFTSNDIIVLTFTPFICYFARDAKIDPIPYLICEFVAANTWSMALMIGNPTNIYLATAANVSFLGYTAVMLLPTLFAGFASFGMLYLLFRRKLRSGLSHSALEKAPGGSRARAARDRTSCSVHRAAGFFFLFRPADVAHLLRFLLQPVPALGSLPAAPRARAFVAARCNSRRAVGDRPLHSFHVRAGACAR